MTPTYVVDSNISVHSNTRSLPLFRPERLARRLRFAVTDIRNGEEVKEITRQPGPRPRQERLDEVKAVAARAGIDGTSVSRGVGYKEVVQAAGGGTGPAADVTYVAWKLCSGIAHGDFWPTWSGMDRAELPGAPAGPGRSRSRRTSACSGTSSRSRSR